MGLGGGLPLRVDAATKSALLDGFDGGTPRLRPPANRATTHQLLTHTAGLGYWLWEPELVKFEQLTGTPNVVPGTIGVFDAPMLVDPGERFRYGINLDWLGHVVETVAT